MHDSTLNTSRFSGISILHFCYDFVEKYCRGSRQLKTKQPVYLIHDMLMKGVNYYEWDIRTLMAKQHSGTLWPKFRLHSLLCTFSQRSGTDLAAYFTFFSYLATFSVYVRALPLFYYRILHYDKVSILMELLRYSSVEWTY